MATELKHTVKPSGGDYTTLDACMDHLAASHSNLVTADVYASVEIDGTWSSADTAQVTINGMTTDATRYINIYTTAAARHDGKYDTGAYRIEIGNNYLILQYEDYVRWDGIQFYVTSANANQQDCYYQMGATAGANDNRFSNCIFRSHGANRTTNALFNNGTSCLWNLWNCIFFGYNTANENSRIFNFNGTTLNLYSCTGIGGYIGLNRVSGTATAKNCYFGGSGGADYNGTITETNCASEDTTAGGTNHTHANVDTDTFINVTAGSEDFHLAADGLSPLQGAGVDTSGDAAPFNFTTDIDGQTRDATWDIGADAAYVAAGETEAAAATVAVASTVTGGAQMRRSARGAIAAIVSVVATACVIHAVAGAAAVTSTASARAYQSFSARGAVTATSSVTGSATVLRVVNGSAGAISSVSGSASVLRPVAGTINAASSTSGAATVLRGVSGSVAIVSSASGDATVAGSVSAVGTVTVTSSVTGAASCLKPVAAAVAITSSVTGDADCQRPASGTVTAVSTVAGDATVIRGIRAAVNASSVATASAQVLRSAQASAAIVSTVTGAATTGSGTTQSAAGTVTATSTVAGAAIVLHGDVIDFVLNVQSPVVYAQAAPTLASTVSGDLLINRMVAGTVNAVSSATGRACVLKSVNGAVAVVSSVSGTLSDKAKVGVAGSAVATFSATARASVTYSAQASVAGVSSVTASAIRVLSAAGSVTATSSATATAESSVVKYVPLNSLMNATLQLVSNVTAPDASVALGSPMNATLQLTSRITNPDASVSLASIINSTVIVGESRLRE